MSELLRNVGVLPDTRTVPSKSSRQTAREPARIESRILRGLSSIEIDRRTVIRPEAWSLAEGRQ
jgi:hypothetical protein